MAKQNLEADENSSLALSQKNLKEQSASSNPSTQPVIPNKVDK